MNKRINQLKKIIKNDPDDPFLHYALGLEFIKEGEQDNAKLSFDKILMSFTDYLPVYYQAAQLFIDLEKYDLAKNTFESGIRLATKEKDTKTLNELKNAYQNFLFEYEED
jgi:tetratricopeptide (TPR) repeat protein